MNGDSNPLEYVKDQVFCLVIILVVAVGSVLFVVVG